MPYRTTRFLSSEKIVNNSICVLESGKVRNMSKREDIDSSLVYVCNELHIDDVGGELIEKGRWCRCLEGIFMPRQQIYYD